MKTIQQRRQQALIRRERDLYNHTDAARTALLAEYREKREAKAAIAAADVANLKRKLGVAA